MDNTQFPLVVVRGVQSRYDDESYNQQARLYISEIRRLSAPPPLHGIE